MSGRSEVTPSPLQPRALAHHMMHLPLNPNPPRTGVPSHAVSSEGHSALTALHNIFSTPPGGHLMPWNEGPRTQPHTPTPDSASRFTDDRPRFHLNHMWEANAFEEEAPAAGPEAQAQGSHPEAEAALAEDEEEPPLEGAELTAAEAEVGGRFDFNVAGAKAALHSLRHAMSDSWDSLEVCSLDKANKAKYLAKVKKHLSRMYDLQPLLLDSEDAARCEPCIGEVRSGLEALQAIAQGALDDASTEVDQLKRHVRVLRSMLNPLAREPGGRATPLCGICMTRPVSHVVMPCGHTLCEHCSDQQLNVGGDGCFRCRVRVAGSRRIYF